MSSDAPSPETAQDISVRLKPLFGVDPKHYLAGIYLLIILAALFAFLVFPGLSNPGTRVTVTSTPPGASVSFAGKHWGTTPLTAFLPEKKAELVISKPGFEPDVREYSSGNNVFFSLLFPKSDSVAVPLKASSDHSVTDRYLAEIGRWALAAPFTSAYRFPPLFTGFAADAAAAGLDAEAVKSFLLSVRAAVADPQMYLDYGRALGLWAADAPVPEGLEAQLKLWEPLVGSGSGRLALWLLANQTKPVRDREVTEPSDWFKARTNEFASSLKLTAPAGPAVAALKGPWGNFRGVPGMTFAWGSSGTSFPLPTDPPFALPVAVTTAAFWVADTEVSQAQFAAFTAAVPQWAPEARDALIAAGRADADYLATWKDGRPQAPQEPVASVSWYAAQAYVAWLNESGKVPAGKKAVLPDEFQWEAAARAPGGAGLLNQGVWEWTASAWYPGQSLVLTDKQAPEPSAYARSLKGGVQSGKDGVKAGDRAGWPATGATTGLGFRIALVGNP